MSFELAHEPEAARIVVGVDGSPGGEKALQFAFDEASVKGAPLTAVHAFPRLASTARFGGDYRPLTLRDEMEVGERVLAEAVVGWPDKYPEVEFSTQAIPMHPRHALVEASEHAALLVIGSHGHGAFGRLLPGSVTQATLHPDRCPVAIVR